MRYTTKARFQYLESMVRSLDDKAIQKELLYVIESIKSDIEQHYAEIIKPIRLNAARYDDIDFSDERNP